MANIPIQQQKYYSRQSIFTDPGRYALFYKDLSNSVSELCKILQGIIMHCDVAHLYDVKLSDEQKQDRQSRYAEKILHRIIERDNRPLAIKREPSKRFAGNCRDFALMLCSILRYQRVPSRLRCGFATYFEHQTGFYEDHWVCEYWNANKNKWILVDAELDEVIKKAYKTSIDPLDISYGHFLLAGKAWQMCRSGKIDPNKLGVSTIDIKGAWFVRGSVLRDFASLNKVELMPWDYTEFSDKQFQDISELPKDDIKLIDRIADLTTASSRAFEEIRSLYDSDPRLQVHKTIRSYVRPKYKIVNLKFGKAN